MGTDCGTEASRRRQPETFGAHIEHPNRTTVAKTRPQRTKDAEILRGAERS